MRSHPTICRHVHEDDAPTFEEMAGGNGKEGGWNPDDPNADLMEGDINLDIGGEG